MSIGEILSFHNIRAEKELPSFENLSFIQDLAKFSIKTTSFLLE